MWVLNSVDGFKLLACSIKMGVEPLGKATDPNRSPIASPDRPQQLGR